MKGLAMAIRNHMPPHPNVSEALEHDLIALEHLDRAPPVDIADLPFTDHWLASDAQQLVAAVGSWSNVEQLSRHPHPPAEIESEGLDHEAEQRAHRLFERISIAFSFPSESEWFGLFARAINQLSRHDEQPLVRRCSEDRLAAAVAWLVLHANDQLGRGGGRLAAASLWAVFNVTPCTDLGRSLGASLLEQNAQFEALPSAAHSPPPSSGRRRARPPIALADPELLHSVYRSHLINRRTMITENLHLDAIHDPDAHPVQLDVWGGAHFNCANSVVRWATRTVDDRGRAGVVIALEDLSPMRLIGLSVPDAHRLIAALQHALGQPVIESDLSGPFPDEIVTPES